MARSAASVHSTAYAELRDLAVSVLSAQQARASG
jgi:hypothetical protein